MNETNGPGAVVPEERGCMDCGRFDACNGSIACACGPEGRLYIPSPQPVPGSDAELTWSEHTEIANLAQEKTGRSIWPSTAQAVLEAARSLGKIPAVPPQESDKGRDDAGDLRAGLHSSTDRWGSVCKALGIDASASEFAVLAAIQGIKGDLAQARAELQTARDAYAELLQETKLTEEAGGAVARAYRERDEALRELAQVRAALLAYQEAGKVEPDAWAVETANEDLRFWGGNERESAEQVAERYGLTAIPLYRHPPAPADVSPDRSGEAGEAASLRADAIRSKVMRREPITDAERCLLAWDISSATDRASFERGWEAHRFPADVVTVPREEWEALREIAHIARPRCKKMDESALLDAVRRLDAIRSSAQAGEGGVP